MNSFPHELCSYIREYVHGKPRQCYNKVLEELKNSHIDYFNYGEYGYGTYTLINKRYLNYTMEIDGKKIITEWVPINNEDDAYFIYHFSEVLKTYILTSIIFRYDHDYDEYVYHFNKNSQCTYISYKSGGGTFKKGSYSRFNESGIPIETHSNRDCTSFCFEAPSLEKVLNYHRLNKMPILSF